MNVNKKLGRFKQWAGERMGGEVKTTTSDEFKALEMEMTLRHEGMDRMHRSMNTYVKTLSKRNESEDKEKTLAVAHLGTTMVNHGEDFEPDSEFGTCLASLGRANERIGRMQETYVANATSSWLESLERSLVQMKEYQAARKKLESRRLAYDSSLSKMQKSKKEDFRMEEELRSQKAKYEESSEEVYRRMQDIKEAEIESVADLTSFMEAELMYYDRCREVLMQLKRDWPATESMANGQKHRSRSNTAHSFYDRNNAEDEPPMPEPRITIRSNRLPSSSAANSPRRELPGFDFSGPSPTRPPNNRSTTFEGPRSLQRDTSPAPMPRLTRVPTEPSVLTANRSQLRQVKRGQTRGDVFGDPTDELESSSPDRSYGERSVSPATSYSSIPSRTTSCSNFDTTSASGLKKVPPPPPPSRSKKPPPPPPMKKSALSTSEMPYA
ncbi:BAR domain-containing protein [Cryomyces antarcticus]